MNTTPRTDAAEKDMSGAGVTVHTRYVPADLARQLERELAEKTESLAFQTQLNREAIEREKQTFAELAAEREQVAILRSDEKRLVAFAKTYRMNAEILSDKLAAERGLADRLAALVQLHRDGYCGQVVDPGCDCCDCEYLGTVDEALAAWKEARHE